MRMTGDDHQVQPIAVPCAVHASFAWVISTTTKILLLICMTCVRVSSIGTFINIGYEMPSLALNEVRFVGRCRVMNGLVS